MNKIYSHIIVAVASGVLVAILMRSCSPDATDNIPLPSHHESKHSDTLPADTFFVEIPVPVPGAIDSIRVPYYDSSACEYARTYIDSLVNDQLSIIYRDSVKGILLKKYLSYKLKVPLIINNTDTVIDSIPYIVEKPVGAFYFSGGFGTDLKKINNINVGINYLFKNDYGIGYNYNMIDRSHNLQVFYKIQNPFKRKKEHPIEK